MSITVDVGLLVGAGVEVVLLGMEEGRGFEFTFVSIEGTRVDGSGMMILVPC